MYGRFRLPTPITQRPRLEVLSLTETYDLVVHSHLRWDGVFQRPHHIISRLSKQHRVAFIEEPIFLDGGPAASRGAEPVRLVTRHEPPNVTVVQPFLLAQAEFLPAVSSENQR